MSYPVARFSVTEPSRGLTAALWRQALEKYDGKGSMGDYGVSDIDDFQHFVGELASGATNARDGWAVTNVNAGTSSLVALTEPDGAVGAATVTIGDTTQHNGTRAHGHHVNKLSSHTTDPRSRTVFETRLQLLDGGTLHAGYATATALSATSTLLTTVGRIGFYKLAGGALVFAANSANGGTAYVSGNLIEAVDIVDGDYYKLGFSVNRDRNVEIYVNGVFNQAESRAFNKAALPTGTLQKDVTITNGSATSGSTDTDYVSSHNGDA